MSIKRIAAIAIGFGLVVGALGGCNKPSEDDCRRALDNIRKLSGTDKLLEGQNIEGWVRRCRGASKKATVQCAIGAQTLDQLRACNIPVEAPPPVFGGSGSGSASGSGSGSASGSGSGTGSAK